MACAKNVNLPHFLPLLGKILVLRVLLAYRIKIGCFPLNLSNLEETSNLKMQASIFWKKGSNSDNQCSIAAANWLECARQSGSCLVTEHFKYRCGSGWNLLCKFNLWYCWLITLRLGTPPTGVMLGGCWSWSGSSWWGPCSPLTLARLRLLLPSASHWPELKSKHKR